MATYSEWNNAIADYFVNGMPNGATIYLSVDETALMDIGARFKQWGTNEVNWVEDFREAVRSKCVIGDEVKLPIRSDYQSGQVPNCIAFLAAMVLAAHRMIETEEISQINYFKRLRQILGLPVGEGGRPEGLLPAGVEEVLWRIWNLWLISKGWLPSAERGDAIPNRYINYPLSQALLRDGDRKNLELLFREKENSISPVWDRDTVGSWVRQQPFGQKYLTGLLREREFRRYEAVTDAVYDVYVSINWDQETEVDPGIRSIGQRRLTAQLYRVEDFITENIAYHLYPRQLRQFSGGILEVIQNGRAHSLREERQGWFMPLWSVDPAGGMFYEVRGHPQIKELVLPERDFWILVRDRENENSGVFAGWGHLELGETFILLCRKEYTEQMEFFKDEALLNWDHSFSIDEEWIEYRECKIISPSWDGIIPQHQDLYDALKPSVSATISFKGGLRVPDQGGWLEGYAPEATIIAFDDSVNLKLLDTALPDKPIMHQLVDTNKPISVPCLAPGVYLFEVYSLGKLAARRVLQILPWDSLACPQPKQPFDINVGIFSQQGAVIKMNERK